MSKNKKSIGSRALGNRTVIGIICVVAALAICFGVAPMVNKLADGKAQIVRVCSAVPRGSRITESDIEFAEVGSYNLPKDAIRKKEDIVGKFAFCDLYPGDYLFPEKLTADELSAQGLLDSLTGEQKAISVSIGSFALGLSGKLETGDIISVIVYSPDMKMSYTPPELQYVKVITSTTSQGVDKANITDTSQPVTVTLLVNQKQAELLALYEKTSTMHFVLEYRGDPAQAQKYLDAQTEYLKEARE